MSIDIHTIASSLGLVANQSRFNSPQELLPWFTTDYKISDVINDFWGLKTNSRLIATTKDINDPSWKGLVSEWDSYTASPGQFRLNKSIVRNILNLSLGEKFKTFELRQITVLELSLFENFFVELENYWKDFWRVIEPNSLGTFSYLVWAVELDNQELGLFAIGVPPGLSSKQIPKQKQQMDVMELVKEYDFEVALDLTVGKTKLSVNEIKHLEEDDLIIFEESDSRCLLWVKDEFNKIYFYLDLPEKDNKKWADLYYDGVEMEKMTEDPGDLLTDLPIELTAQFKSVNMPLQKIAELESGGVLPLGLLLDSQLMLMAPGGKPIAEGELVIVGNQFGLRIKKTSFKASIKTIPKTSAKKVDTPKAKKTAGDISSDLDKELEDVGIDPHELEELEDLY